jgi:hypothetical protein
MRAPIALAAALAVVLAGCNSAVLTIPPAPARVAAPTASTSAPDVGQFLSCVRRRAVIVTIFTYYPDPSSNACWSWLRTRATADTGDPKECLRNDAQHMWAYNEITFSHTAAHDKTAIQKCYDKYGQQEGGYILYARRVSDGAYPLTGHRPTLPAGGLQGRLLELYNGTGLINTSARDKWLNTYRGQGYSAMINVGGEATVATVKAQVLSICRSSTSGIMGIYAGSGEASRLTQALRDAVASALNTCTTVQ